ncbi:MAG: exo-alpha-sialidase [Proteobacteria bacterium]|nr:exo-alpha-sialidase [Pseudomonadota bacterium]HQR03265.1 exo-alpha-sialidase [Rhodocyclaceae bacterium]
MISRWLPARSPRLSGFINGRWPPLFAFCLALAVSLPWLGPLPAPHFQTVTSTASLPTHARPDIESTLIPNPAASAHAVTLAPLGPDRIAAAWFAGSREGAEDVAIVLSRYDGRQWEDPVSIITRERVQHDTRRLVRKLGNPLLWTAPDGALHLWFVSVSYGGWAGSALNHTVSRDEGRNWSRITRWITSPFWNLSTLVRAPPVPLANGELGLPVYHEFIAKRPEWLRLQGAATITDKLRLPAASQSLQPAIAALDTDHAIALLRDAGPQQRIRMSHSVDGGAHWSSAVATELPNPNAGIALLRLNDGRLLLAYNPSTSGRSSLALALSVDAGNSWSAPRIVDQGEPQDEFSYPALLQDESGVIHLAYTWKRERIKHLRFYPDWLKDLR